MERECQPGPETEPRLHLGGPEMDQVLTWESQAEATGLSSEWVKSWPLAVGHT